jgi:hypothetical protein
MGEKLGFPARLASLGKLGQSLEWVADGRRIKFDMTTEKLDALACRRGAADMFSLSFISRSKRWNFENRTESTESRASERNGPFGEK